MTKLLWMTSFLLTHLLTLPEATAAIDGWSGQGTVRQIKRCIEGCKFEHAPWDSVTFGSLVGKPAAEALLAAGEAHDNWKSMPLSHGETNVFSLLGRAYAEGFPNLDFAKASRYLIYGRALELRASASTGEAIAYSFTRSYSVGGVSMESPDDDISKAIETLQAALEAEAAGEA